MPKREVTTAKGVFSEKNNSIMACRRQRAANNRKKRDILTSTTRMSLFREFAKLS